MNLVRQWSDARRLQLAFLFFLVIAGAGLRAAAWVRWHPASIESEGAEYARIAQNLLHGAGYVGINTPGTELMFPPLFPWMIAATSLVTHNYETAGRLVAFILGSLLPLPVFFVARRLFGRRVAAIAAVLAVLHPLFIGLSIAVYSEGPYLTILLSAFYLVLRAFDHPRLRNWLLVGVAFGIAYLLRQEAFLSLLFVLLFLLLFREQPFASRFKLAATALGAFLLVASPEIILVHHATGTLRLEGKSPFNLAIGQRTLESLPASADDVRFQQAVDRAVFSIDDQLNPEGVAMLSNADIVRQTHIGLSDILRFGKVAFVRNTPKIISQFSAKWFGAPFLTALALLGIFAQPFSRTLAFRQILFLLFPATSAMATFSVIHAVHHRYYFVLVPFLVIWAAKGLVQLAAWTNATLAAAKPRTWPFQLPGALCSVLVVLAMLGYALKGTRELSIFSDSFFDNESAKLAGAWIVQSVADPSRTPLQIPSSVAVKIMDLTAQFAYYANGELVHFPYCDSEDALRFADAQHVDYIVLSPEKHFTPYYQDWLRHGIPSPRAQLVYSSRQKGTNVVVFRWHHPSTTDQP